MSKSSTLSAGEVERLRALYELSESMTQSIKQASKEFKKEITTATFRYWVLDNKTRVPKSERVDKISDASREECIEDLKAVAALDPERVLSRNHYRNHGRFSDSAWSQYFGTFEEFRRQAGLILSRHARRMETNIARHSSVDAMRALTEEKRQYAGTYKRPTGKRFVTHVGCSDVHDIECDPFWRECFIDTVKRVQPDVVDINGDLFDMPEFGKYGVDPREWDVVGRIKWGHQFLEDIRKAAPEAELNFIEGNHEHRMLRHLSEATPAMKAILSDLHGFTVPKLLGLDKYEINYVAPADLAVFTQRDTAAELRRNFLLHYDFFAVCHFPEAERYGVPGWNGHHHRYHAHTHYNPTYGSFPWIQSGSGHKREASYTNGEKWSMGFPIAHIDKVKKKVQFEYIDTTHDHVMIGGKFYSRSEG